MSDNTSVGGYPFVGSRPLTPQFMYDQYATLSMLICNSSRPHCVGMSEPPTFTGFFFVTVLDIHPFKTSRYSKNKVGIHDRYRKHAKKPLTATTVRGLL